MGNKIGQSITPPPLTLQHCLINGRIDFARYRYYRRRQDDIMVSSQASNIHHNKRKYHDISKVTPKKRARKTRSIKRYRLEVRDPDGSLREIRATDTLWYLLYVAAPPTSDRMQRLFRQRFRLPYSSFLDLSDKIQSHHHFQRWTNTDAVGCAPSNIKLLLLGALRYIGRAWTFDNVSESNGILAEVNRKFMLTFISYESTVLCKKICPGLYLKHKCERT